MILLIDSSQESFYLGLLDSDTRHDYNWFANRQLAKGILTFINDKLAINFMTWSDITAIGVFQGPGSFTGLRIGLTVANTLADSLSIPIVSGLGANWQQEVLDKLNQDIDQKIITPFYGAEAHITKPKK